MNLHSINLKSKLFAALAVLVSMTLSGCDLVNDESDCVESYNLVRFVYDHNMKFTCAFDNEVEQLTFLLFDSKTGVLAKKIYAPHAYLNDANEMVLTAEPGEYDILVWAGTESKSNEAKATEKSFAEDYDIPLGVVGESTIDEFNCYLKRKKEADGNHIDDVINDLYHGSMHVSLPYAAPNKPNRITVPLMKNTNTFRIVLQQTNGGAVSTDDYELTITDSNGWMNADNSLRADETLTYHPWFSMSGSVDVNSDPTDAPGNAAKAPEWSKGSRSALGASLWELTTSRLDVNNDPRLVLRSKSDGKTILDISPKDYALLVKGFYNQKMDDQEYLDRQDEYNMTFFLSGGQWLSTVVVINNWRIVRNVTSVE